LHQRLLERPTLAKGTTHRNSCLNSKSCVMQKNLSRICALLLIAVITNTANSQVTALSNNTNLESGGVVNGKAILISRSDSLWISNGTAAGTVKLTSTVSIIDTLGFALFKNKLFFAGKNAAKGVELWATDGTAAGTVLIKDIRLNAASSLPRDFFVFNNTLYFSANDGLKGIELWTSDGTAAGTILLKDIFVGATSGIDRPQFFANGTILYFVARDATNGKELWKTNGTAAGTLLVKNITAGAAGTTFTQFTHLGTATIFSINVLVSGFD